MHSNFPQFLMKLHNFLCLTSDLTFKPQTVWPLYQPLKKTENCFGNSEEESGVSCTEIKEVYHRVWP